MGLFSALFGGGGLLADPHGMGGEKPELCHMGGAGIAPGMWSSGGILGAAGQYPPAPNSAQQQANQLTQTHAQAQYNANPTPTSYERTVFGVNPIEFKAQQAITTVVQQIPMRVATSISKIVYEHTENNSGPPTNPVFAVIFTNAHYIKFTNVDSFPLEEDVARICLEAP